MLVDQVQKAKGQCIWARAIAEELYPVCRLEGEGGEGWCVGDGGTAVVLGYYELYTATMMSVSGMGSHPRAQDRREHRGQNTCLRLHAW